MKLFKHKDKDQVTPDVSPAPLEGVAPVAPAAEAPSAVPPATAPDATSPAATPAAAPAAPPETAAAPPEMAAAPANGPEPSSALDPFELLFDEWLGLVPFRESELFDRGWKPAELIRVEQTKQDGALVVRAELPGIDPAKDIELTVSDGILCVNAERREETSSDDGGFVRREVRYDAFRRLLPIPAGVTADDITATYVDGVLEVRIPAPSPAPATTVTKVPIATS